MSFEQSVVQQEEDKREDEKKLFLEALSQKLEEMKDSGRLSIEQVEEKMKSASLIDSGFSDDLDNDAEIFALSGIADEEEMIKTFKKQQDKESSISIPDVGNISPAEILEFKDDPLFVVKEIRLKELEDGYRDKLDGDYNASELAGLGKKLYNELGDKYGIESPVNFFIGLGKNNEPALFSIIDKIEPVSSSLEKELASQEFHRLYESLSEYFLDKLRNKEFFLTDINGQTQYVYGKKVKEEKATEKIFLVDTDLYLDNRQESLLTVVYWLARHSVWMEEDSRMIENIKTFVDEYKERFTQVEGKNKERLEELEGFLSGQSFGNEILPAIPTFE